jgi:hypothetical protein
MAELYETLRDNPQAAVTFVTTEHFNLQTGRAATISESNGRTTIFLGTVSAGLVALAFAGQVSKTSLIVFGLLLFPVLFFLGLVTFERVLQCSIEDTLYLQRINRIRRFYMLAAPGLADHLGTAAPTDNLMEILSMDGYTRSRWQTMFSVVSMIGVINSVLAGATAGMVVAAATGQALWPSVIAGLVVLVVSVPLHQAHQKRERLRKPWPFSDTPNGIPDRKGGTS